VRNAAAIVVVVAAVVASGCGLHRQPPAAWHDFGGHKGATQSEKPASKPLVQTVESTNPQLSGALLAAAVAPSAAAYRRVGQEYRRVGILDQAHEYFTRAVKLDPADATSYEALARIWRDWGTPALGLADAYRAVHYAPESASAANTLGTMLQALGYAADAKAWYGRALSLDPQAWYALNNLCYAAIMTRELAIDMCNAAVKAAPDAVAPRNNLALAHAAAGDLSGAQKWFRRSGDTAESHYNYGVTLMGRREYAQAAEAFQKALQLNPLHAQAAIRVRQAEAAASAQTSAFAQGASASARGATADRPADKPAAKGGAQP
jgi:tetratricopeptide (TPR) repeat protein